MGASHCRGRVVHEDVNALVDSKSEENIYAFIVFRWMNLLNIIRIQIIL